MSGSDVRGPGADGPDDADAPTAGRDGAAGRHGFGRYRDLMARHGFQPSRRLGQNFLLEPALHRAMADAVDVTRDDLVLEVGPGLGFLTRELLARAGRVLAVEVDPRLADILTEEVAALPDAPRLHLLRGDVLARGHLAPAVREALAAERAAVPGRTLLVANLPYAVAGPTLAELWGLDDGLDAWAVLVQLEMAERLVASPGTRPYGTLTAMAGLRHVPRLVRRVGREVFRPRPQVDSAIAAGTPRADAAALAPGEGVAFGRFLQGLFSARRKRLRNAVAAAGRLVGREPVGLDALRDDLRRPEELSPDALLALWRRFFP